MYKREFKELLRRGDIPKSLLFYGECDFQREFYLSKSIDLIKNSEKFTLYFDEYNFESAKAHISQSSLFGDISLLIIKHNRKLPANELKELIKISHKNENSYFLFEFSGEVAKAKEMEKFFNKKFDSASVRFFKLNFYEAKNYMEEFAKNLNIEIDTSTLSSLFTLNNENLALSINEIKKLSILNRKITNREVTTISFGLGDISLDDFIIKLINGEDIREYLNNIIEFNDEIKIINFIENYISTLFLFYLYIREHNDFNSKEILGFNLPPQIANQKAKEAMNIDLEQYKKIFDFLIRIELKLKKSTKLDKSTSLISSLIKLQTLL